MRRLPFRTQHDLMECIMTIDTPKISPPSQVILPSAQEVKHATRLVTLARTREELQQKDPGGLFTTLVYARIPAYEVASTRATQRLMRLGYVPEDCDSFAKARALAEDAGNSGLIAYLNGLEQLVSTASETVKKQENFTEAELAGLQRLRDNKFAWDIASQTDIPSHLDNNGALQEALKTRSNGRKSITSSVERSLGLSPTEQVRLSVQQERVNARSVSHAPPSESEAGIKAEIIESPHLAQVSLGEGTREDASVTRGLPKPTTVKKHKPSPTSPEIQVAVFDAKDPNNASVEHYKYKEKVDGKILVHFEDSNGKFLIKKSRLPRPRQRVVCRHLATGFANICNTQGSTGREAFMAAAHHKSTMKHHLKENFRELYSEKTWDKIWNESDFLHLNKRYMGEMLHAIAQKMYLNDQKNMALTLHTRNENYTSSHLTTVHIEINKDEAGNTHCHLAFFDPNVTNNYISRELSLDDTNAWKQLTYGMCFPRDAFPKSDYMSFLLPKDFNGQTVYTSNHFTFDTYNVLSQKNIGSLLILSGLNLKTLHEITKIAHDRAKEMPLAKRVQKYNELQNLQSLTTFGFRVNYEYYNRLKKKRPDIHAEYENLKKIFKPTAEEQRQLRQEKLTRFSRMYRR